MNFAAVVDFNYLSILLYGDWYSWAGSQKFRPFRRFMISATLEAFQKCDLFLISDFTNYDEHKSWWSANCRVMARSEPQKKKSCLPKMKQDHCKVTAVWPMMRWMSNLHWMKSTWIEHQSSQYRRHSCLENLMWLSTTDITREDTFWIPSILDIHAVQQPGNKTSLFFT